MKMPPSFGKWAAGLLASLWLIAPPAWAGMWKWIDSEGVTQYTDLPPPPSTPASSILKRGDGVVAPAAEPASKPVTKIFETASAPSLVKQLQEKQKLEDDKRKAEAEAAKQKKAEEDAKVRAENCKTAQTILASIKLGGRMASVNDKGERVILDPQQIEERRQKAQDVANRDCQKN